MRLAPLLTTVLALAVLAGCAQQPTEPPAAEPEPEKTAEPEKPEPPVRPFTSETLYALLAAELAGSREQFDIALANYLQQAHLTRDPQVAQRATLIARFMDAEEQALEAALLWVEVAPDDSQAQLTAAVGLIERGRLQEAFELARQLHADGNELLFQNIAASSGELTDTQRERLLDGFLDMVAEHPDNQQLLIGTGLLLQQQGRLDEALTYAERAQEREPESIHAAVLKANLFEHQGRDEQAVTELEAALDRHPDSRRLRLQLARTLTETDLERAQAEFAALVDDHPGDPELRLSLGLVAMERGDTSTAEAAFEQLVELGFRASSAHYYLGELARARGDDDAALSHYQSVEEGNEFYAATVKVLEILVDQERFGDARRYIARLQQQYPSQSPRLYLLHAQTLMEADRPERTDAVIDEGLQAHPADINLLYTRAMLQHQRDNLAGAELDLRTILKYDPHNAMALNALGYILTDGTDRHEEAHELISTALALEPDDPAIIDSMGWVHYRMGNYEQALTYLRRAMDKHPDHEIAAHLGEVLWVVGRQEEAREVWQRGLELDPDSEIIRETMERLTGD